MYYLIHVMTAMLTRNCPHRSSFSKFGQGDTTPETKVVLNWLFLDRF